MKSAWVVKNGLMELGVLVMMMLLLASAHAQAPVQTDTGVGRISLIHGDVSTQRGDSGDWAAATLNAPIVSGDKISTGDESRAEVQLDYSNIVRLGNRTQANISTLSRTQIQVQVAQGIVNYTVFKDSETEPEIDTPNAAIHPYKKDGSFRIETFSNDETRIIVRNGQADISTPQGSTQVKKGQMITVRGSNDNAQYQISEAPGKDDWDRFNNDRDNLIHTANSWRNTNRYYVGSEDLDAYGHWDDVPDYGRVWVPAVSQGWVPYRDGRWVWEPYYGWTWVSYEPWGWAPYHYGRWFFYESSWVWWPGPVYSYYRPIWAPAYVSFFGFGGGFGIGFNFGHVAWLPIGPCDRFYPWYGRYGSRFNEVNITNVTNITNITNVRNEGFAPLRGGNGFSNLRAMNNPQIRQAFSGVPAEHFGTGRVAASAVSAEQFHDGHFMMGNLPVVPSRESLLASNRAANPATLPGVGDRHFFGRQPASPQRFDVQAGQLQQAIQRDGHFAPIQTGMVRGDAMNGRGVADTNRMGNSPAQTNNGWHTTNGGSGVGRSDSPAPTNNNGNGGGWHTNGGGVGRSDSPAPTNNNGSGGGWQRFPGRSDSPAPTNNNNNGINDRGWRTTNGGGVGRSDSPAPTNNNGNGGGWHTNGGGIGRSDSPAPTNNNRGWGGGQQPTGGGNTGRSDSPAPTNNNRGWGGGQQPTGGGNTGRSDSPAPTNNNRGWGGGNPSRSDSPAPTRGGWGNTPSDNSGGSRGWGGGGSSRPPLNMSQPIVTPRQSEGGGSFHGGSSNSGGGSRNDSGSHSQPSQPSGRSDSHSSGSGWHR